MYVQSHGDDDPARAATPFYLAFTAAAMDCQVCIYFTMKGPTLLRKGAPEQIQIPRAAGGGAHLRHFIDQAVDLGVKLYVCQPSLDLHGFTEDDLIEGVEMIGGAAFNDLALEADAVIAF
ncbi:MAG: DsrE family protein [Chloroflexi bacterium]|nr:DsrE family protein [Chloroflexota bacterium]